MKRRTLTVTSASRIEAVVREALEVKRDAVLQLVERGASEGSAVALLYGKMEEDEFALDFAFPLSLLNAFAIVLTTWGW